MAKRLFLPRGPIDTGASPAILTRFLGSTCKFEFQVVDLPLAGRSCLAEQFLRLADLDAQENGSIGVRLDLVGPIDVNAQPADRTAARGDDIRAIPCHDFEASCLGADVHGDGGAFHAERQDGGRQLEAQQSFAGLLS